MKKALVFVMALLVALSASAAPKPKPKPAPVLEACIALYAVQVVVDHGAQVSLNGSYTHLLDAQQAATAAGAVLPAGATSIHAVAVLNTVYLTHKECDAVRKLTDKEGK